MSELEAKVGNTGAQRDKREDHETNKDSIIIVYIVQRGLKHKIVKQNARMCNMLSHYEER